MGDVMNKLHTNVKSNIFSIFFAVLSAVFLTICVSDAVISVVSQSNALLIKYLVKLFVFLCFAALLFWILHWHNIFPSRKPEQNSMVDGRETGMDLVRTIAALFVISVHHVRSLDYYQETLNHFGAYFATYMRWLFFCCVAMYFTISGYFLRKRELSESHYLKFWRILRAYILICVIVQIAKARILHIDWTGLGNGIFTYAYSGFMSQYVWLYCLIPFLNIIWNNLTRHKRQILIIICICVTSLYPSVKLFVPMRFLETYPITYYFIGAYIAEYKPLVNKKILCTGIVFWLLCISIGTIQNAAGGTFNWMYLNTSGLGYEIFPNVMITILVFLLLYNCSVRWGWLQKCVCQLETA